MGCDRCSSKRCGSCDFGKEIEGGLISCNFIGGTKMPYWLACQFYVLNEEFK
jgi:hypothetical protein